MEVSYERRRGPDVGCPASTVDLEHDRASEAGVDLGSCVRREQGVRLGVGDVAEHERERICRDIEPGQDIVHDERCDRPTEGRIFSIRDGLQGRAGAVDGEQEHEGSLWLADLLNQRDRPRQRRRSRPHRTDGGAPSVGLRREVEADRRSVSLFRVEVLGDESFPRVELQLVNAEVGPRALRESHERV